MLLLGGNSKNLRLEHKLHVRTMTKMKLLPTLVVAMMVCAVMPVIGADGVDSEVGTANAYGEFNFWINYGEGWSTSPISGDGYNACIAIQNATASANTTVSFKNIDGVSASDFTYTSGYYSTINSNYGTIDAIGATSTSSDKAWFAYYYSDGAWHNAVSAIGFYKPFSDYDANFRTANMAFSYGVEPVDVSTIPSDETMFKDIVQVPTNASSANASDFAVSFQIKLAYTDVIYGDVCSHVPGTGSTAQERLAAGISITGYGSDAALALNNAISTLGCVDSSIYTSISSEDEDGVVSINSSSYGYCDKLFGVEEYSKDNNGDGQNDEYWYWSLYLGNGTESYASYLMGWYTPLSNGVSGFSVSEFTLHYDHSAW